MSAAFSLFGDEPASAKAKRYPEHPGAKRQATSFAAADAIAPRAGTLRDQVHAEIKRGPATADEVAQRLGQSVLAVRPRTTELLRQSLIADSGERRPNASGRNAIVWRVA